MPGLLIVNADDWGATAEVTDAIAECFAAGAISSASAMVWMLDSDRAAELARRDRLAVGLHLNLTEAFDAAEIPVDVSARQARLAEQFEPEHRRHRGFLPALLPETRRALREQLTEFERRYGASPDHLDGHQHVHLNPTVLPWLPRRLSIRLARSGAGGHPLKRARDTYLRRRFTATVQFHAIEDLVPELGGTGIDAVLQAAQREPVEIMCHPGRPEEREFLLSPAWLERLRSAPLGTYADL